MDLIAELTIIATLIQLAGQLIKNIIWVRIFPQVPDWLDQLTVVIISLMVAFSFKSDLIAILNESNLILGTLTAPSWVGQILFALLISRGSSGIHDILGVLENKKNITFEQTNFKTASKKSFRFW